MLSLPPCALYIHLPWCARKCPYCDFNSHAQAGALPEQDYVRSLLEDLDADRDLLQGRELASAFIGGGTPSLFSAAAISDLLAGIRARTPFADGAEITLEANPGSAESAKFLGFRAAGVNRLSLGVQSFDGGCLQRLGRVHDAAQAHAAVAAARAVGFERINIDLMHGLPGQDLALALADLEQAIAHDVPHLSWYQLTIEPNTVFHSRPPALPADEQLADIQQAGSALLQGHGYRQYEVSAWARPGYECRHNLNYWRFGDYLGIGAGAHGKATLPAAGTVVRTQKTRLPQDYLAGSAARREPVPRDEIALEYLMNALRLREGVAAADFEACTGLPLAAIEPALAALRVQGLLEPDPSRLRTTALGFDFLNDVLQRFADTV